jgi:predicted NBD/HSP70 family sugar kinase
MNRLTETYFYSYAKPMSNGRRTTRDLRRANRAAVLRRLYFDGASSRLDLARSTGVSPATVGNVVTELLAEGIVAEAGQLDSEGGRPAALVEVNPAHAAVIGVDVGESGAAIELFELTLGKLAAAERPLSLPRESPEPLVALVAEGVEAVLREAAISAERLLGIGIGVPGVVVHDGEEYVHAPSLGWEKVPLLPLLRTALPAPVLLDNGAKTMGRAEAWFGAGRGASSVIVLLIGTGVGAAVVVGGEVQRGATSSAGEWGHTTVVIDGRECRCGASGCLEAYVGASGILASYRLARRARTTAQLDEHQALERFRQKAEQGEEAASEALRETGRYLGVGIANLVNLLNPDKIVVGGWAGLMLGELLLPLAREEVARHALRPALEGVEIELCELGPDAVALGAATLAVEPFLAAGGARSGRAHRSASERASRLEGEVPTG